MNGEFQYSLSSHAGYSYESNRDLLTQVRNYVNGGVVSQYDYTNDALVRRTAIARSGSAMTESRLDAYGYLCVQRLDASNDNGVNLLVVWDPTEQRCRRWWRRGLSQEPIPTNRCRQGRSTSWHEMLYQQADPFAFGLTNWPNQY